VFARLFGLAWLPLLLTPSYGADSCAVPAALFASRGTNIFNAAREADLGDFEAQQLNQALYTIDDPRLTSFLERVGSRIASRLPASPPLKYSLIDWPYPEAFVRPGGHIYVSRKIVAEVQDENELAGLLAHEIGHAAVHQPAVDLSKEMRVLIGVHEVTDRQDVFEKYNRLIDNGKRNPEKTVKLKPEANQIDADQIAVFAMASAGYDPEAMPRFFDRLAHTRHNTGGFLSDFFNTTPPASKRLHEMIQALPRIPESCRAAKPALDAENFKTWQAAVARYDVSRYAENLPGLMSRISLAPPLRSDLKRLRFSPDGRYILAQDDTGIDVLSRQPFALAFRIEADNADPAQFSADSKTLSFSDPLAHVEVWDLASAARRARYELFPESTCIDRLLASDARTFACYTGTAGLFVYDVSSGEEVLSEKLFGFPRADNLQTKQADEQMTQAEDEARTEKLFGVSQAGKKPYVVRRIQVNILPVRFAFSPDGCYLLAATWMSGKAPILFNVAKRAKESLPMRARKLLSGEFTFLSDDRLLSVAVPDPKKSSIVSFPEFKTVDSIELLKASYEPVTKGDYLLMRPFRDSALAVVDVPHKQVVKAGKTSAFDIYGDQYVAEKLFGELGLYRVEKNELLATLQIPAGDLRRVRRISVSPDGRWLVASNQTRGEVWDLTAGQALFNLPGLSYTWFDGNDSLLVEISKARDHEARVLTLHPAARTFDKGPEVKDAFADMHGRYLLVTKPAEGDAYRRSSEGGYLLNVVLELHDAVTSKLLWSKPFKEAPTVWLFAGDKRLIMEWSADNETGRAEIKADPALRQRWNALDDKESAVVFDIVDPESGAVQSRLLVDTGNRSFAIRYGFLAGGYLLVADTHARCLVYSLATGKPVGRVFGGPFAADPASGEFAVENGQGSIGVYQLPSLRLLGQYQFDSFVRTVGFLDGGKQFVAITERQQALRIALPSQPK